MDRYGIDHHKLHYHPQRVADWLAGRTVWPIYMELSPAGACNHRCTFCGLDYVGYQTRFLAWDMLRERIAELGRLGLKSLMHGGEGEPLLHRDLPRIVEHGHACGIDQALTTNGVLFTEDAARRILPHSEWVKVSINAGTRETYAAIHRTKPADFDIVLANIERAAALRARHGWGCTLGLQMVLLPENRAEAATLAARARELGADYLVIKPYSQHPRSETTTYKDVRYHDDQALAEALAREATDRFQVILRARTMRKWDEQDHPYNRCLALPFWSYVDAGGNVWGCSVYLGDERFRYGNLYEQTFRQIWEGERRRRHLDWVARELDARTCRLNCRMDEANRYLWALQREPPPHVNFI